jgi:plasmid stabilization system protein ParE
MIAVYAPRALRDLEAIAEYLRKRSPSGAARTMTAIKASIDALVAFPAMCPAIDSAGHRRLPVLRFPYTIFYRIAGDEILILHIRHASRRPIDPERDL